MTRFTLYTLYTLYTLFTSFFLLLQSCSSNPPNFHQPVEPTFSTKETVGVSLAFNCIDFYSQFDHFVDAENVRDVQASLLENYPYLSVNRFLLSFAADLKADLKAEIYSFEKIDYWLSLLAKVNLEARQIEWMNLSSMSQNKLSSQFMFDGNFKQVLEECSEFLLTDLTKDAKFLLLGSVSVNDDYGTLQRFFGVYWLSSIVVSSQIRKHQRQAYKIFETGYEKLMTKGELIRYELPRALSSEHDVRERSPFGPADSIMITDDNPLNIPKFDEKRLSELFAKHAPILEIDEENENDVIGTILLNQNGLPDFSADHATVYVLPYYTRFNGEILLQLNYVFWFASRAPKHRFDIYSGKLDGLIWRVTLDKQGNPLMYDSVHNCGCYHKFYLTKRVKFNAAIAAQEDEPPFVVKHIVGDENDSAIVIRIGSGAHFVNAVYYSQTDKNNLPNQLQGKDTNQKQNKVMNMLPYKTLRSLAKRNNNGRRSMFMSDGGLVRGTARAERWLLWPMGINSAGAMRQWGHHAVAFVGKRYFDGANLLDRYFSLN